MSSFYRQQLEEWLKKLDVKADVVFDIGGAQSEVRGRVKSWQVEEYAVIDLPIHNLEKNWSRPARVADIVFCLEVFEYLINPLQALENIKKCLIPRGGRAYVTFAFAYPHHEELESDSLRYTEPGIKRLASATGLEIRNIWYRVDRSGMLEGFYKLDKMHPSKRYAHHDVTGFIVEFEKI
jgi:SAM-dependent methyltransferase